MKINLVKNGIFPITKDINGNPISEVPDTNYLLSGTIQGEGVLMGVPCLFIRTSGCNLRCMWRDDNGVVNECDTPYSSFESEKNMMEIDDVIKIVLQNTNGIIRHIVISGGEPMLQINPLNELVDQLSKYGFHITIETNGTIYDENIASKVNLFSISPKLSNSTPNKEKYKSSNHELNDKWSEKHEGLRRNIEVLQKYVDKGNTYISKDYQLKFVVNKASDIEEIQRDYLSQLSGVKNEKVLLMPEGILPDEVMTKSRWIIQECIRYGYRFTTRMHTLIWGTVRGV